MPASSVHRADSHEHGRAQVNPLGLVLVVPDGGTVRARSASIAGSQSVTGACLAASAVFW